MTRKDFVRYVGNSLGLSFRECLNSTRISGYAWKDNILYVIFGTSPKKSSLYKYYGVSKEMFRDLDSSKSKGVWIQNNLIKPKVKYEGFDIG
jgi:hypothetical protein